MKPIDSERAARATPFLYLWKHSSLDFSPFVLQNEENILRIKRQRSEEKYEGFVFSQIEAIYASKQQLDSSEIQAFIEKNAAGFLSQKSIYEMNADIIVMRFNRSISVSYLAG